MKKFTAFVLIFMMFFSNIISNVSAAVNTGQAGQVLKGDYVVIVNTNLENSQSTGNIVFDDSGVNINAINEILSEEESETLSKSNELLNLDNEEGSINTKSTITTTYKIGDQKEIGQQGTAKKTYTLIGIGNKSYIWMENSLKASYDLAGKTNLAASEMIKVYEGRPYELLSELSNNNIPYLDNSGKLSILLENTGGNTGYYGNEDDITSIHINTKDPSSFKAGGFDGLNGLLAHEGQHALFRLLTCKGNARLAHSYIWINEGISVAVMDYLWGYFDTNGWLTKINDNNLIRNGSSLIYSDYRNTTVQDYSMPYLFVRYLASQATNNGNPIDFLKKLYTMDATGKNTEEFMNEIINTIPNFNGKTFKEVLGSFYVAAFSPEKTGEYSLYGDTVVTDKVTSYPIYMGESNKAINLEPTAAIVIKTLGGSFEIPSDAGSDIKFYVVNKNNDIYKPAIGSGTAADPYIITNEDELNSIGKYPTAYFKLGNNIDITKGSFFTAENFSGNLNGDGYSINNLNKPLISNNNGVISNLNINAKFNTEVMSNLGVITNVNSGVISDIKVSGTVNINAIGNNPVVIPTVGGIVGENQPAGIIERVSFEADLTFDMAANGAIVGGIVGLNAGGIKNSYSKGNINISQNNSGGFIANIGGLTGRHKYMGAGTTLRNSYSIMNLSYTGSNETVKTMGSLVGSILNSASVNDCYGIDTYNPIGSDATNLTGKKSLSELQNQNTFANWDFNATWKMDINGDRTPIFKNGNDINSISATLGRNTLYIGEKLFLSSSDKLTVNGVQVELTEQMLNMNEFDSSVAGQNKIINGSYMGKNFTVSYNIEEPKAVSDLQIVEQGKVEYFEGENYTDEGVVLKAKLNGNSYDTLIYSGYTNNLNNSLTKNDIEVEISYFGQRVKQPITVKGKEVALITVFNKADKTTYVPGNTINLTGIRYQINYSDGSKSTILGNSDLNSYNLKVAQTDAEGKNPVAFDLTKKLEDRDNNTKLHIYYGNVLPGQAGSISAEIMNLSVVKRLHMEDKTFRAVKDKANYYWESDILLNANYDVETTFKTGSLPPGITLYTKPSTSSNKFGFDGTPTQLGTYVITYTISKLDGSDSIDVTFTFNVENPSNEALLEALTLKKSNNPSLPYDIEGVIDNVNNTIKFTVPYGTDVTKLKPSPTYYKNSSLPANLWNGAIVDFTNPVAYEVTAEDGKTKKTYMVSVEIQKSQLDKVTEVAWDRRIAKWNMVSNATNYELSLYKDGILIETITVYTNSYDLTQFIKEAGEYRVTVVAKAPGYQDSEATENVFIFENAKPVISGADDVEIKVGTNFDIKAGVSATDKEDLDLTGSIDVSGELNINAEGVYELTYSVTDSDGNKTSVLRKITVTKEEVQKQLDSVTGMKWNGSTAMWNSVLYAEEYEISLYKNGVLIKSLRTTETSIDLSEYMIDKGEYKFEVVAKAEGFKDSVVEEDKEKDNIIQFPGKEETPENPDVDEKPETPENPDMDEKPEIPENPDEDEKPETPENPDGDEKPETPENPDVDEKPEIPENPGVDEKPEVPENPGIEEGAQKPEISGDKEEIVLGSPNLSGETNINNQDLSYTQTKEDKEENNKVETEKDKSEENNSNQEKDEVEEDNIEIKEEKASTSKFFIIPALLLTLIGSIILLIKKNNKK